MKFGWREIIFFLLLLALPVASYFLVFQPRNRQIAQANQQVLERRQKLSKLETATRQVDDLGREIQRLESAIGHFENRLPAQQEVDVILRQVWEVAMRHQLMPQSVHTDKPILWPQYSQQPIRMTITGSFDGFYAFLIDLERLERITGISKLEVKRVAATQPQPLKFEFVLSIFFEPSPRTKPVHASGKGVS